MCILLLICGIALLPQAHSLTCNKCDTLKRCGSIQEKCPTVFHLCGTRRTTVYDGEKLFIDDFQKSCYSPDDCTEGSLTRETLQSFFNISCCSTDNCKAETPRLPSIQTAPNGRKCYSCDESGDCNKTMICTGNETFCFYQRVTEFMGCATKSLCVKPPFNVHWHMKRLKCCEGDFCNGKWTKKRTGNSSGGGTRASLTSTVICLFVFLLR